MHDDRWGRWIYASNGLSRISHFAPKIAQGLGQLDCSLIEADAGYIQNTHEAWKEIAQLVSFDTHLTQSYLWVLGAYELVRTIDQRANADVSLYGPELPRVVREQKHRFERLRVPLAKLEASRRHPTDYSIAYPSLSLEYGAAWQLDRDVFVSRRELSDELLPVLERLRAHLDMDQMTHASA